MILAMLRKQEPYRHRLRRHGEELVDDELDLRQIPPGDRQNLHPREAALAPPPSGAHELYRAIPGVSFRRTGSGRIGEVANGRATGRTDATQITLYKSVGVAARDAAVALVLDAVRRQRVGTTVDL